MLNDNYLKERKNILIESIFQPKLKLICNVLGDFYYFAYHENAKKFPSMDDLGCYDFFEFQRDNVKFVAKRYKFIFLTGFNIYLSRSGRLSIEYLQKSIELLFDIDYLKETEIRVNPIIKKFLI